ncbi:hypothetical protein [Tenacibaculum sp. 190524A05c]|uniref:Uncharacterized protein n=1 Tax=Tenacibaculum platacis TaxID=3137852 RepID=A0ABM9P3Y7_9FLAO
MARKSCWNKISTHIEYILTEIKDPSLNFKEEKILRFKENQLKQTMSLKRVSEILVEFYNDIYDINLFIYKSKKQQTIVEIRYYLKALLDSDFRKTVEKNKPMLHCKVAVPIYAHESSRKFDVNWEFGGIRHQLNLFFYKLKHKWEYGFK